MSKSNASAQPKSFKVSAPILAMFQLPVVRTLTSGNGNVRHISHRIHLGKSKSFEAALAACEKYETAQGKPVAFCLVRQDGTYALDLDQNQIGMLIRSGYRMDQLTKVAKGQMFEATVDLRLEGDEVLNVRTGETVEINSNHAVIQAPAIVLNESIAQSLRIEDSVAAMVAAKFGIGASTVSAPASNAAPASVSEVEEFPTEDELAEAVAAPAKARDTRGAAKSPKVR